MEHTHVYTMHLLYTQVVVQTIKSYIFDFDLYVLCQCVCVYEFFFCFACSGMGCVYKQRALKKN